MELCKASQSAIEYLKNMFVFDKSPRISYYLVSDRC